MTKNIDQTVKIFDLSLFSKSKSQLLNTLRDYLSHSSTTTYIFTPNPEQVVLAQQDEAFKQILQSADILLPDGIGLVWMSHLVSWVTGAPTISQRLPGREVAIELVRLAQAAQVRTLVVGGRNYATQPGELEPGLWWFPGYQDSLHPTPTEEAALLAQVAQLRPAVVLVALGAPAQEQWVAAHRRDLEKNGVKVVMTVGGSFDVYFGKLAAPPRWLARWGGEWLFRLWQQPSRWRRQLRLLTFIGLVIRELVLKVADTTTATIRSR